MGQEQQLGLNLRDEGMRQVLENTQNNWRLEVASVVARLAPGEEVTGEDIKTRCRLSPHHHNAWGAVINRHVRSGELEKTGEYRQMRLPAAHARVNPVYRKVRKL